jgi:hypothetical protein
VTRFLDEELDRDEAIAADPDAWGLVEEEHGRGLCRRCGIAGHRDEKCPTITPVLLKNPGGA